ncbi:MAG TPA: imidazolonepropionase [Methanomassiliicoccales archaeon]|nr:imidazolonepropionase [Methanomassiliicoccales archaeon]
MPASPKRLIGPFAEILTMDHLPLNGSLRDDELEVVRDGGVLLSQGRILEVLGRKAFRSMRRDLEKDPRRGELRIIESEMVLMPGMVDAHTHMCYAGDRSGEFARSLAGESYRDIAAAGGGILSTVRATRKASEDELVASLSKRAREHLERGITTCEVKSGYGLDVRTETRMLKAIRRVNESRAPHPFLVPTCLAAHVRPPEFKLDADYLDHVVHKLLPSVMKQKLAGRVDIYVDDGAFTHEDAETYLVQAKELGFVPVLHADQFSRGGSSVAAHVGALSADHLEHSTKEDLEKLRETGVIAVVLPGSAIGLGVRPAPAREMLDLGLSMAIASDWNPGSAPMGDLLIEACVLAAGQKLTVAEVLAGVTVRGANALGLTDRGVIKSGMQADLIGFECASHLDIVYRQGALRPSLVMRSGKVNKDKGIGG